MKTHNMNTTTSPKTRFQLLAVLCLTLAPIVTFAHGGMEHVQGTVKAVSDTSVTVTTKAGKTEQVALDAKTTYTRASKPIQKADIKVGDRVVIHAEEIDEKLIARTVELGTAAAKKAAPAKTSTP